MTSYNKIFKYQGAVEIDLPDGDEFWVAYVGGGDTSDRPMMVGIKFDSFYVGIPRAKRDNLTGKRKFATAWFVYEGVDLEGHRNWMGVPEIQEEAREAFLDLPYPRSLETNTQDKPKTLDGFDGLRIYYTRAAAVKAFDKLVAR